MTRPLTIDDSREAIGQLPELEEFDDFGDLIEPCTCSPAGQHVYSSKDGHRRCIFCGVRA